MVRHLDRVQLATGAGLVAITVYFAGLTWTTQRWPYDRWMALVLVPVLFGIGAVIVAAVTGSDEQPLTRLLLVALALKLAASFLRYFVASELYGSGDSVRYDVFGARTANTFHRGELTLTSLLPTSQGSAFVDELTGFVYTLMGPSRLGGFVVFSWLGFWGLFLFHRAALVGLPSGNQRRYAMLVCFLPSMVFWPSSIGKEALMMLSLGTCALGAARFLERRRGAWWVLLLGVGLAYMVRPHVGVLVMVALAVAVIFRRRPGRAPTFGPVGRVVTVALLILGSAFVLSRAVDRFLPWYEQDATGIDAVEAVFERASTGTADGGSEIERPLPNSPTEYPQAAFTVLFRPMIYEASSAGNLVAALETTLLLGLFAVWWRNVRAGLASAFAQPYILFCLVYTAMFCFAWSAFSNLGALARQRVQVWPFLLILLAATDTGLKSHDLPARRSFESPAPRRQVDA